MGWDAKQRERKYETIEDVQNDNENMMNSTFMNVCSYLDKNDEIKICNESSYCRLYNETVFYNDKIFSDISSL